IPPPCLGHRTHHLTWVHQVPPDPLSGILHSRGLGEQPYSALGRLVLQAAVVYPHEPKLRRDVDDRATTSPAHGGNSRLAPQEDPLGVNVHDPVPFLSRGVFNPP